MRGTCLEGGHSHERRRSRVRSDGSSPRPSRLVLAVGLWAVVSVSVDRPVAYDAIAEQFKYGSIGSEPGVSLLRPVGGVLPPYWVFRALPDDLPRQAARRLRVARLRRRAGPRAADRRVAAPAARHRPGRPELRRVPHRHGARGAWRAAADRARHAGAPARSAGVRGVRARLHARQPAHGRQHPRALPRRRRARRDGAAAAARRPRRPAQDRRRSTCRTASRRSSATACRGGAADAWTRSTRTRRSSSTGRSSSCPPSRAARRLRLSRRSGTRRRARACTCTGTATTIRSTSGT